MRFTACVWVAILALVMAAGPGASAAEAVEQQQADRSASEAETLEPGLSRFTFDGWAGPRIRVWTYVPSGIDTSEAPILFVMHGANRDARRYITQWQDQADAHGFVAVAPEFTRKDFPGAMHYNLGNVYSSEKGRGEDEELWSFSAIEPLFDTIVARLRSAQQSYVLYGHSAGAQFAHRYMYFKPRARVRRVLLANAGWYTFPDLQTDFPYGLYGAANGEAVIRSALAKDVVILLGGEDTRADRWLNQDPEPMKQGSNRLARGQSFHAFARDLSEREQWRFNWSMQIVDGVGHDNGGMARAAGALVR